MNRKYGLGLGLGLAAVILAVAGFLAFRQMNAPKPVQPAGPPSVAGTPLAPALPAAPFACAFPENPPAQPDGATADAATMKASHDTIQHYVELLEAFQACRNRQVDDPASTATAVQKQTWIDEGNDSVDKANLLATQFSAQLKIWHSKHPGG